MLNLITKNRVKLGNTLSCDIAKKHLILLIGSAPQLSGLFKQQLCSFGYQVQQEQIIAFNLGVDEYLVKPLSKNILDVRVASLFKRYIKSQPIDKQAPMQLGDLTLFPFSFKWTTNCIKSI